MSWRMLLDLIFPPQCAGCNALGSGFCRACARAQTIRIGLPTLRVTAFGPYEGTLRSAVLALKDGRRDVAEALGHVVAPLIEPGAPLVPIPTTAKRRRVRGLDGVALVARFAAEIAGAQILSALQHRSGPPQHGRSRIARLAARGRFVCDSTSVAGKRIVLFDDVCTTGSTLRDCADAVREAGGLIQDAVVLAVTKTDAPWRIPVAG
ncbi:MAG: ComF family protein [Candidatus Eremiobacteraeota bacterium]|nr:ComF family protein [Candidatus Eremiobacteraeota bacterium]